MLLASCNTAITVTDGLSWSLDPHALPQNVLLMLVRGPAQSGRWLQISNQHRTASFSILDNASGGSGSDAYPDRHSLSRLLRKANFTSITMTSRFQGKLQAYFEQHLCMREDE